MFHFRLTAKKQVTPNSGPHTFILSCCKVTILNRVNNKALTSRLHIKFLSEIINNLNIVKHWTFTHRQNVTFIPAQKAVNSTSPHLFSVAKQAELSHSLF